MNNLTLLQHINAKILYIKKKIHEKGSYFAMIPFKGSDASDYLSNFDNALCVRITKIMLDGDKILNEMNNIYNKKEKNVESFSFDNQFWIDPDISIPDDLDPDIKQDYEVNVQIPDNLDPNFGQNSGVDVQIPDNLDPNFGQNSGVDVQIPDNLDPNFGQDANTDIDVSIPENIDPEFGYISELEILDSLEDCYVEQMMSLNYPYYAALNELIDNDFNEDALVNFNTTFINLFKEFYRYSLNDPTDYLEHAVINFYSNGMWDDATILMTTIFDTMINTTESSSCGCGNSNMSTGCGSAVQGQNLINTGTSMVNIDNATCVDKYKAAMFQWLQNILSDYKFYCKWMMIDTEDGDKAPETIIIDKMIQLLNLLLESDYDLSSLGSSNNSGCGHRHGKKSDCGDYVDFNSGTACTNYSIIKNYIKLLEYVKNDEVLENKNKIYIYGKQFAAILPLLSF